MCIRDRPFADYVGANITVAAFISLFVCLIPTTIGGLLSAIGIAGMDRALRANVITKSGKAVETAGDIDTLLLDKTGTITIGNRKATGFYPVDGFGAREFVRLCVLSSVSDPTPEGKSIVEQMCIRDRIRKGCISTTSVAIFISRASTFLPRNSGVRPTIRPLMKTAIIRNAK